MPKNMFFKKQFRFNREKTVFFCRKRHAFSIHAEEYGFDFNSAVNDLLAGKKLTGEGGILTPLIKELVETALSA